MSEAAPPIKRKKKRRGRQLRNWIIGFVGPTLLRLWLRSLRLRGLGQLNSTRRRIQVPLGGIYVFWHQRILTLSAAFKGSGIRILISQHGDGEMISRVILGLGMIPVRGSSTRGGARACLEILRGPNSDASLAISPDGPRGPPRVFQNGAIYLASRTGFPIYPITVTVRRCWYLPTWDKFLLPCPFSRALFHLGEPIVVPPDAGRETIEALRQEAESKLRELTEVTDREFEVLYATAQRL